MRRGPAACAAGPFPCLSSPGELRKPADCDTLRHAAAAGVHPARRSSDAVQSKGLRLTHSEVERRTQSLFLHARRVHGTKGRRAPQDRRKKQVNQTERTGAQPCRVAVYCRVSMELELQEGSFERQRAHYEQLIAANPAMTLVDIYFS